LPVKRLAQRIIIICVVLAMVSACATTKDSTRTKAEGTAGGAVIGGGIGWLVGRALGNEKLGAAIGAVAGGTAGYAAGSAVADKKQEYAKEEDQLNEQITIVAQHNEELDNYNMQMTDKIASLEQDISSLKSRYSEDQSQIIALKDKQAEITKYVGESNTLIENKKKELVALNEYQQTLKDAQNNTNAEKLGKEVDTLKNNIAMLDKNNVQMAKLVESLNVSK